MDNCYNCKFENELIQIGKEQDEDKYFCRHIIHGRGGTFYDKGLVCDYRKPKEEEKVIAEAGCECGFTKDKCKCEKTPLYTTGQMIDMWLQDNSLRFEMVSKCVDGSIQTINSDLNDVSVLGWGEVDEYGNPRFVITNNLLKERWRVVKPTQKPLKQFSYGEACKLYFKTDDYKAKDIKCPLTGDTFKQNDTQYDDRSFTSYWTIEGVYEDDKS